jgi:hypothetical protein
MRLEELEVLEKVAGKANLTVILDDGGHVFWPPPPDNGRNSLYKSLSKEGKPELATGPKVIGAWGMRLEATAAP